MCAFCTDRDFVAPELVFFCLLSTKRLPLCRCKQFETATSTERILEKWNRNHVINATQCKRTSDSDNEKCARVLFVVVVVGQIKEQPELFPLKPKMQSKNG